MILPSTRDGYSASWSSTRTSGENLSLSCSYRLHFLRRRSLRQIRCGSDRLVGLVNVAWDGGVHAFILDTCVIPQIRRIGIATRMVVESINVARERGAKWLHADFEPHLCSFYRSCGFRVTQAGLMKLN
ncbi:GNAT family N-acetyltransferase [Agrobacterium tumefaciens]|uniref:GNAT family N-acetyltransferase n=1 Tax=Agrobacterium tumefaciens TaxID=358 RepID=UPI002204E604|nr:GNAT family N-acetyltransferase [Agrobacterium tumefaciens]